MEFKNKGPAAQRAWVWENFTSGNNVAFMDPYLTKWPNRNSPAGNTEDPNVGTAPDTYWDVIRDAMGPTLTYANRMKLVSTKPQPTLSSTGFCLANPGTEYLVYQPLAKPFTLQLAPGIYQNLSGSIPSRIWSEQVGLSPLLAENDHLPFPLRLMRFCISMQQANERGGIFHEFAGDNIGRV